MKVALFPLPEAVLFPHARMPLHIFEPRYRAMTADSLAGDLPIAIGLARAGEDLAGHAAVHEIVGVGSIERHQRLPDGRYHLVLRGLTRARIVEELSREPYRLVRAEPVADRWPPAGADALSAACVTLRACVARVCEKTPDPSISAEVLRRVGAVVDPSVLVDTVAGMFLVEAADRQRILEEPDVSRRLETVTSQLADLLLRAESVPSGQRFQ